jgi:hypothetical protein
MHKLILFHLGQLFKLEVDILGPYTTRWDLTDHYDFSITRDFEILGGERIRTGQSNTNPMATQAQKRARR